MIKTPSSDHPNMQAIKHKIIACRTLKNNVMEIVKHNIKF